MASQKEGEKLRTMWQHLKKSNSIQITREF
jgi:hypothetical protein